MVSEGNSFSVWLNRVFLLEILGLCIFSVVFFLKGIFVCMGEGNGFVDAFFYALLWGFTPFIPFIVMGVYQAFMHPTISKILYVIFLPFVLYGLLFLLPVAGKGKNPKEWLNLSQKEKYISMVEDFEETLRIAKSNPKSNEAIQVDLWEAHNNRKYESLIQEYKNKAALAE